LQDESFEAALHEHDCEIDLHNAIALKRLCVAVMAEGGVSDPLQTITLDRNASCRLWVEQYATLHAFCLDEAGTSQEYSRVSLDSSFGTFEIACIPAG
jgi:hypothetical protein